jgi:hypothetical protein
MSALPAPVAVWREDRLSDAALPLTLLYWHFDTGTGRWDLVSDPTLESGKLADVGGGVYDFVAPASAVASFIATIKGMLRGTDILVY